MRSLKDFLTQIRLGGVLRFTEQELKNCPQFSDQIIQDRFQRFSAVKKGADGFFVTE